MSEENLQNLEQTAKENQSIQRKNVAIQTGNLVDLNLFPGTIWPKSTAKTA